TSMIKFQLKRASSLAALAGTLLWMAFPSAASAVPTPESIVYTMRFAAPETHIAQIEAVIPTGNRASIELMMPVWSPGYYAAGNYARNIEDFTARGADGTALRVEKPKENHWRIQAAGAASIIIAYRLLCESTFVTGSWVGQDFAVIN